METKEKLIVALDVDYEESALRYAYDLKDHVGMFKVGSQLFTACGPSVVKNIINMGGRVMLDLKYHDTPLSMASSVAQAARLGVDFITVHASSGHRSLRAAAANKGDSKLLAVTVLTSFDNDECQAIYHTNPHNQIFKFAKLAYENGIDGIVCAATPEEADSIKSDGRFLGMIVVSPGIRFNAEHRESQSRIVTPGQALLNGADYIVMGRPILHPSDPCLGPVDMANYAIASMETVRVH